MAFNRFAGVALPSLVYVGIEKREDFEKIDAPAIDHRMNDDEAMRKPLLSKAVEGEKVTVIFQHFLDE